MTRTKADALVLLAALIWGVAFYFQKTAMLHLGPMSFLTIRATLALVALAPFAWRERSLSPIGSPSIRTYSLLGGLAFFAAAAVQQIGIVTATVTNTSFLTALYVVLTPFLLWLIRRHRPAFRVWIAAIIAFTGIWLLGGGTIGAFSQGDALIALSAIGWSLYMIVTGASGKVQKPMQYTFLHFIVIAALALPFALHFETTSLAALKAAAIPVLYVGIMSSAVTFTLTAMAARFIPASHAAILLSTETLFGAAAGYVMLGERLSLIGWGGATLVIIAMLLVQTGRRTSA